MTTWTLTFFLTAAFWSLSYLSFPPNFFIEPCLYGHPPLITPSTHLQSGTHRMYVPLLLFWDHSRSSKECDQTRSMQFVIWTWWPDKKPDKNGDHKNPLSAHWASWPCYGYNIIILKLCAILRVRTPWATSLWGIFSQTSFIRLNLRARNDTTDSGEAAEEEKSTERILIISSFSNLGKQKSLRVFSISTPSEAFLSWQASLFHKHSTNNLRPLAFHSQIWKCEFHGSLFSQPPDVDERGRVFYCVFSRNRERSVLRWACSPPTQVATMWPEDS